MKKWQVGLLVLLLLTITGGMATVGAVQPRKVTVAMTYIPNVQFVPWYVAAEKGFFRAEGLDVNFDYRMDIDALPLVASGQLDYAIAGGDQVLTARSHGIPVVYLASLYAKFPPTVISLTQAGIHKPQDLRGKKVGLPLYGTNLLAIKAILKKAKVAESDVELIDIGYTQIPSLTAGKVDAVVGFANNEPLRLKAMGYSVNEIRSGDYFPLVGHGLITGAKQVKTDSKRVRGMVRATIKGMRYALEHPDEAFEICRKYIPEMGKGQLDQEKRIMLASMELWQNEYSRKHGLGTSDIKAWEESQGMMLQTGLIKKTTPVKELLNQKFLPGK
jgi:NitT/TauT family transport system substrate-binding protein